MEKRKLILFYELCRLCLEKPGAQDMFGMEDLVKDILLCTGVKVQSSDNLPRKICMRCLDVVINAKRLRVMAKANEMHLKSLFEDVNEGDKQMNDTQLELCEIKQKLGNNGEDLDKDTIKQNSSNAEYNGRPSTLGDKIKFDDEIVTDIKEISISQSVSLKHSISKIRKIAVRKDLFGSSAAETSSTKTSTQDTKPSTQDSPSKIKIKRIKTDKDDLIQYECELCKKKFNVWKKFYLHQRSHNRNVMCPLDACGKKFATKGDLEKHIRTHTGERPYCCEICDKRFAQRGTLKAHRETVHAEEHKEYII